MNYSILNAPTFTTVEFLLSEGESLHAQPGCMLAMTTGLELKAGAGTHMQGEKGWGRAFRSALAGESFFSAIYTSKRDGERLVLSPPETGEIRALKIDQTTRYYISSGAYLASTGSVQLKLKYAGLKGWLATRGLFLLRTEGCGEVFVSSYGAIQQQELEAGEHFVLDNRYVLAFSESVSFETVKVAPTLRHAYLSGEGMVNRFSGPGTILYQTRARPTGGLLRAILDVAT